MAETTKMAIEGVDCEVIKIKTQNTNIFLIKSRNGFIACGYLDIEAANKFGDAAALVPGATSIDEMLNFRVSKVSNRARELGITESMTGKMAITKLG